MGREAVPSIPGDHWALVTSSHDRSRADCCVPVEGRGDPSEWEEI